MRSLRVRPLVVALPLLAGGCVFDWPTDSGGWTDTGLNVVFVTSDGVRWQEFFRGTEEGNLAPDQQLFADFHANWKPLGTLFGDPSRGGRAVVSNPVNVSQPGYESMFAGHTTECLTNTCPQVTRETFLDRLRKDTTIGHDEIAVFATWDRLKYAVTSKPDDCCVINTGTVDFDDGTNDPVHAAINAAMHTEPLPVWTHLKDGELPTDGERWDRHTWGHAIHFLEKHHPRFTYVSLGDSDEWGHHENWAEYTTHLARVDGWMKDLRELLARSGDWGAHTVVVFTTDHGRGSLHQWGWHGPFWPTSRDIWMFVQTPASGGFTALDPTQVEAQHRDLRPTFELLFGLEPATCDNCGHPLLVKN